ncbi:DNA polymerase IV [Gordonia sp. (in: high G+C Gram-positive bacteria)]|uniref:DNA polymerase IV n=1 Tax=unclassified Gordonia (in: high G+C Gram-positive bacteria) TaxID=2657482 RepID=UPI002630C35F|nr:DNA polymerase IV [Gordonia sp. (in: high G+C Gram-positive bacteria)]
MRIERAGRSEASILHADLDSFYASVEQRDDPGLRGRPVLVGGGVVLAASYEAKACGVRTPMPGREARALCRGRAVTVAPRFAAYVEASRAVFDVFGDTTPIVEGISVDEAFLDVGGLRKISGSPREIATRLRERVRGEVGLPITVGIARTKFLAKVASGAGKPDGLLEVPPDGELAFLHPLPVRSLWGVGRKTEERLTAAGIRTVGDMAAFGESGLAALLGQNIGRHLYALAMARDPRRVETGRRRKSIGAQRALGRRIKSERDIEATLLAIVDGLGKRLRGARRVCRTVVLRLRFDDYSRVTRSRSLGEPTDSTAVLLALARGLFDDALPLIRDRGCTLIGLSLTNLSSYDAVQLALPFDGRTGAVGDDHAAELDVAIDELKARFGRDAVTRGRLVGRQHGDDAPMLPD